MSRQRGFSSNQRISLKRHGVTFVEVLVLIGIIVFLTTILLGELDRLRQSAGRVPCASNLRQIGQALLLYSNENHGEYPRTRYDPDSTQATAYTNPLATNPFGENGPAKNDVTAATFLLLRTQDLTTGVFRCPQTNDWYPIQPSMVNAASSWSNFPDRSYLSYSFLSPYSALINKASPPDSNAGQFDPTIVIAADMSPGIAEQANITPSSSAEVLKKANSPNHEGDGQNDLYGDGHVDFQNNPLIGPNRTNIFSGKVPQGAAVSGANSDITDLLLPTIHDGPTPPTPGISDWVWRPRKVLIYKLVLVVSTVVLGIWGIFRAALAVGKAIGRENNAKADV